MLIFTACTPPNDVGSEVLPDDDFISGNFVDTFAIRMTTLQIDTMRSYLAARTMLGNYVDPELGHIFAETYLQPRILSSNVIFSDQPQFLELDSIVLRLDLTGFYGRFDNPLELEVFEVTESFPTDVAPNTQSVLAFDDSYDYANGRVLDFSGLASFLDFVSIRLDDSLGRKLLFAPEDSLINNTVFTEYFKGLIIRTKPINQSLSRESGGVFYINPSTDNSILTMFYKDSTVADDFSFDISSVSNYYTRLERTDVAGRLLDMVTQPGTDPESVPYSVIQAGGTHKVFVDIPGIPSLEGKAINRAELILPVDTTFFGGDDRYAPPPGVIVYVANEDGTEEFDLSQIATTASFNPTTNQYNITLTNNIQTILAGRLPANGFIIVPADGTTTLNRAILAGPGHPFLEPKFRVVYTDLPTGG